MSSTLYGYYNNSFQCTDIIDEVKEALPLVDTLHLGHTPVQIKFFKTQQQRGSRKFEYWQHLVQMKALISSIEEARLDLEDLEADLEVVDSFWSRLTRHPAKRDVEKKKVTRRWEILRAAIQDKELELKRTLEFVSENYADMAECSEEKLLEGEEEYWITRLSRQLAFGKMAMERGLSPGDIAAIAALPEDMGKAVLIKTENLLNTGAIWDQRQLGAK